MIRILSERRGKAGFEQCAPHRAQRWSVYSNTTRLASFKTRREAEQAAAAASAPRRRSRDACLGQRWSDVVDHVAGRRSRV